MNKPKIIPYAVCFDGGFPPFLRMYDVNEDNILLLLLFFGVVAINLLLFNSYSRTPTQQLVLLMGSFFSPTLASFFVASFVFHKKNVVLSQKYSTPKTQLTKTHLFLIKNNLYIRLFCRLRRPCAFGVIEGQR